MRIFASYIGIAATIAILTACNGNEANSSETFASTDNTPHSVSYEWREIEEQVADDASPIGFWEVDIRYPQFSSSTPKYNMDHLNKQVIDLRDKYTCAERGDQTFTVDVTFSSSDLVSLTYESMWYCQNMPRPDSRSGVLNFSPATGKNLILADEIATEKTTELQQLLAEKAQQKAEKGDGACKSAPVFDTLYREGDLAVFRSINAEHGAEGCVVSIPREQIKSHFKQSSPFLSTPPQ